MAIPQEELPKPTTGLVNSVASPEYKAPEVKPITSEVNAESDTVEARLNKLTASGSEYLDLAKKDAMRSAGSRGLINSSMAAGAGTDAGIRNAMPIAEKDAATYNETRYRNQDVQNKFLENRQNTNLNKEAAGFQSGLSINEANNQSGLNINEANNQSGLNINEATVKSGLTNEENTLLNDLTMKRDEGLSALTQDEQAQLNELQIIRDSASSANTIAEGTASTDDAIRRDQIANDLNIVRDELLSSLKIDELEADAAIKTQMETILNDEKFSDQVKLDIVTQMNSIVTDANTDINDISLSDRSAEAQAAAIADIKDERAAQLDTYQTLLDSFNDWEWSTDFTQDTPTGVTAPPTAAETEAEAAQKIIDDKPSPRVGTYTIGG